jgi:hypothetical protein
MRLVLLGPTPETTFTSILCGTCIPLRGIAFATTIATATATTIPRWLLEILPSQTLIIVPSTTPPSKTRSWRVVQARSQRRLDASRSSASGVQYEPQHKATY